jgi:hypothetical protein
MDTITKTPAEHIGEIESALQDLARYALAKPVPVILASMLELLKLAEKAREEREAERARHLFAFHTLADMIRADVLPERAQIIELIEMVQPGASGTGCDCPECGGDGQPVSMGQALDEAQASDEAERGAQVG